MCSRLLIYLYKTFKKYQIPKAESAYITPTYLWYLFIMERIINLTVKTYMNYAELDGRTHNIQTNVQYLQPNDKPRMNKPTRMQYHTSNSKALSFTVKSI